MNYGMYEYVPLVRHGLRSGGARRPWSHLISALGHGAC